MSIRAFLFLGGMEEVVKKKDIDWERVHEDYRAGLISNVQIAKENGCSEALIRKKDNFCHFAHSTISEGGQ